MTIFNKIIISIIVLAFAFGVVSYFVGSDLAVNTANAQTPCGACENPTPPPPVDPPNPPNPPSCNISANVSAVKAGDQYTISWNGTPSNSTFEINNASVVANDSATYTFGANSMQERYVFTGQNGDGSCVAEVIIKKDVVVPICDISASLSFVNVGDEYTVTWNGTPEVASFQINGYAVADSGDATFSFTGPNRDAFTLTGYNKGAECSAEVEILKVPDLLPSCDSFTATPSTFGYGGGTATLAWETTDATTVSINNGVGTVSSDGSQDVSITGDITYTLTAQNSAGAVTCPAPIVVEPPVDAPSCDTFSASPSTLPYGGGTSVLTWTTSNIDSVSINNGVGAVTEDGSQSVSVTQGITYTLTAQNSAGAVTCPAPIVVEPPVPPSTISCGQNVTFTASEQTLPRGGGNVDFAWTTTGLDSVSFSGLNATSLSGSESKNIGSNQTVTLIGTKDGQSVSCPLPVTVRTGGGRSPSPRCTLTLSDDKITAGEEVTLTWDTSRSRQIIISDSFGNTLLDTKDTTQLDGSIKLNPTKNTEYTINAKRGTRERTCKVDVEIENNVTVLQTRTAEPRVAGISLTQVPYTGFDATPAMTIIFYSLLTLWGLFVAYIFVIRRDSVGGVSLAGSHDHVPFTDVSTDADPITNEPLAEEYIDAVVASTATPAVVPTAPDVSTVIPTNLPTATPTVGYAATLTEEEADESIEMTELENRAHAQHILLSSDAMRFFMNAVDASQRNEKLDAVIAEAKISFPSEGGWVAMNLARIETLISDNKASAKTATETTPITGGSLAEAIIAGNIVGAYQMIAHRPMIALADAAADLDAVYRSRKGEDVSVSNMLTTSAATISTEKLEAAIAALTSAVDGTYDSEASAVKMAIMKAVKAVS